MANIKSKKVNYEKPNLRNKAKIIDGFAAARAKGLQISLENCVDICMWCKVAVSEIELEEKYEIDELYQIGTYILNESFTVELNKKKLK
ncbi:MAG: hypothetical protein ACW99F_15675 [Candidatus Hodarchaeales archaeon]|jgi:hypothetical protein